MTRPRIAELARQLLENARAGRLEWKEGNTRDSYMVSLPSITIAIKHPAPTTYALELINVQEVVAASLTPEPDEAEHQTLREIHDIARRLVLDVDRTIDEALEYLRRA